jgi:putative tricarboxylic transport membrane protein
MAVDPETGRPVAEEGGRKPSFFPPQGDIAVALVILAVMGVLYWVTLGIRDAPPSLARGMQPSEFPQLVIGAIALMAVIILLRPEPLRAKPKRTDWRTVGLTVLACTVCVVLFEHLGVILTLISFAAFLPIVWGERRYVLVAVYAVVFPLLIWGLFRGVLGVNFPGSLETFLAG